VGVATNVAFMTYRPATFAVAAVLAGLAGCGAPRAQAVLPGVGGAPGCSQRMARGRLRRPAFFRDFGDRTAAPPGALGPLSGANVTPGPVLGGDGSVLAASNAGVLYALDPSTGTVRWTFDPGRGGYGADLSTSPTVLAGGTVLWPGPANTLYALDERGQRLWQLPFAGLVLCRPSRARTGSTSTINPVGCSRASDRGRAPGRLDTGSGRHKLRERHGRARRKHLRRGGLRVGLGAGRRQPGRRTLARWRSLPRTRSKSPTRLLRTGLSCSGPTPMTSTESTRPDTSAGAV